MGIRSNVPSIHTSFRLIKLVGPCKGVFSIVAILVLAGCNTSGNGKPGYFLEKRITSGMAKVGQPIKNVIRVEKVQNYEDCYTFVAQVQESAMKVGGVPAQEYVVKLKGDSISKGTFITGGLLESTAELVCK